MRPLADFLPSILQHASACPDVTAEREVLNAAITFCQRTRCWRVARDHVLPEGWDGAISLVLPQGARLHEIEGASFNGVDLDRSDYTDQVISDPVSGQEDLTFTYLREPFAEAGLLKLSLFLKPSITADELPDVLLEDYREIIAAGALGAILLIKDKTWSDPQRAAFFKAAFEAGCSRNFAENIRGRMRKPVRSRARFV